MVICSIYKIVSKTELIDHLIKWEWYIKDPRMFFNFFKRYKIFIIIISIKIECYDLNCFIKFFKLIICNFLKKFNFFRWYIICLSCTILLVNIGKFWLIFIMIIKIHLISQKLNFARINHITYQKKTLNQFFKNL